MNKKITPGKTVIYIILSLWAVTTIYPFLWVINNSFKQLRLIRTESFSLPLGDKFTLDNYLTAFERVDIFSAYRNSIVISGVVTVVVVILAGLVAYGLARYLFRGRNFVYSLVVASMMFPVFSTIIPVFGMEHSWGIANTGSLALSLISAMLPQIAGNLSFSVIVLMGFMCNFPIDMEESAFLDGASVFRIFFTIILPICKPSFATVAIFTFLWSYNDLFTQMFFLRYQETYTVTRLLSEITSQAGVNYGLMASAVVLVVVPVLVVYVFLQKSIIKGMTAGAIKG